ncbi:hypothetical protein [Actinocrispum wychmicini]|uniref:Major facilitator superfamily (MFS) profile domain-containing protein n=1 Tax=Actinocrispum wychmicini TaxID=1213861 RepID=A0A4R2JHC1_9PSEU|nr:hypothetical protein [Actinocrispum wychmicini]TCO58087.1 hypothetical protein EV192_105152 [Actinocrispum wychmicini]
MDDEGPSPNSGAARLVVVLCAFGLATVGAFTAFFATEILAAVMKTPTRPSTLVLVFCALVPVLAAVGALVISVRAKGVGRILGLGCGTLILGGLLTAVVMFVAAM